MDYEPRQQCPECGKTIDDTSCPCPGCDTELVACEGKGYHLVTRDNFKESIGMCEDCWYETCGGDKD